MKTVLLSAAALTLLVSSSFAENLPQPPRQTAVPMATAGGGEVSDEAPRFDLKFPGGKVKEFVAAVSKALGRPVNVIIPKESEATLIPAVEVSRVTVQALFTALSNASQHEVRVPTNISTSASPGMITNASFQYKRVGFTFRMDEKIATPDAVWTFLDTTLPDIPEPVFPAPPRVVQYYPVAEYLSHFSVEDITAAIESGWALQGGPANPPATIRFHEETKLLICAGTAAQIELIPQVLKGLAPMLESPVEENFKIKRKASQIILPALKFEGIKLSEAVDFIRRKAVELDPEHQGFNILFHANASTPEPKVTLALSNVSALDALKLIAELSNLDVETRDYAILLGHLEADAVPSADHSSPPQNPPTPPRAPAPNPPAQ